MTPAPSLLRSRLEAKGFLLLGALDAARLTGVPDPSARTLLLVGNAGPALWRAFERAPENADGAPDPLDRYTRRVLGAVAREVGCIAVFPFDGPPWRPFQSWALAAGGFSQSPLGVLAHMTFGPWAGFRAALLSSEPWREPWPGPTDPDRPGPCVDCADKPCLSACPVGAISLDGGYDVPACRAHLAKNPDADCFAGCLARRACPVGRAFRHGAEQARLHMASFCAICR
ncbi:hypothetical protein [Polymorphum gilvum]|uniref:4Fe-4S ferredoxin-type domain-containing protein n=1 Tax=Polymorphum gilvum (strain LMG 25793 / CGMCC 1.9160 / SL003B-26A1) TaxID=991905 RepID=F2J0D0_POLGS|nr:hypothetical protein [Polymorphum gilvum]ADZ68664.1 hypothetical protein SL003B_0226 [Polymorphum gilvum SL003B-26A1]